MHIIKPEYEYTKNHHFVSGFNHVYLSVADNRISSNQVWTAQYGQCERPVGTWREECLLAAKEIDKNSNLKPNILFSGGLDSEVVLRSFLLAGVDCLVTIVKFTQDLNQHDIKYAIDVCSSLGITPNILEFDPRKFWSEKLESVAKIAQCFSPQLCLWMHVSMEVEGLPVIGNGNPHIVFRNNQLLLEEGERWSSFNRFFLRLGRPAIPGFFQYTPEQIVSFFSLKALGTLSETTPHSKMIKYDLYSEAWPELVERPKFTGFEELQFEDSIHRKKLKKSWGHCDGMYYIPIEKIAQ